MLLPNYLHHFLCNSLLTVQISIFNCNSGYVRVQLLQCSFDQISGRNYMSNMQINTDAFSWKRGKDKSRELKKISLASYPSFFCFSIFYFKDVVKRQLQICMNI